MSDDDLQRRLEALGRSETPTVDPAFAGRLEADLRSMNAASDPASSSILGWLLRPAVVVAALAVLAGVAFFVSRPDAAQLEFASVEGTSVSIPGRADLADGRPGQMIPDGTRITVGPDGSATVGGVVLDPGTVAIVVNGVVEVVELPATTEPPTSTVAEPTPTTTTSVAAPTTTEPAVAPTVAPAADDPPASPSTAPPTTPSPPTTDGERTTTTESEQATTTSTPTSTTVDATTSTTTSIPASTEPPPVAEPPRIALTISVGPNGGAVLEWTVEGDDSEIAGWLVRRGRGENAEIVAVIRRAEARRQRITLPDRNVAWSVIARSADGETVAASNFVRPF